MSLCPHGREKNTDHAEIFRFAGPIYTCACCHAHWGGFEGDPSITHYCGTCREPANSLTRRVEAAQESFELAHEKRKKFGGPHDPALRISPGASTSSVEYYKMLPALSLGECSVIMADIDPPKPWWKRLFNWWWYGP